MSGWASVMDWVRSRAPGSEAKLALMLGWNLAQLSGRPWALTSEVATEVATPVAS